MNLRKVVCVLALAAMMAGTAGAEGQKEKKGTAGGSGPAPKKTITIKAAHVSAEGVPIDRALRKLSEMLAERSGGRIKLQVYAASSLGGNRELLEQLQLGTLEMAVSSVAFLGGFTEATRLLDLPYLFKNDEAAEQVLNGEVGKAIFVELRKSGFVGLAWMATGWRHLTANDQIRTPAQMKGKKIRVMENQMHIDHFNAIGASAIPMAFSEVYTALQNKTIDCQENPYANIQGSRLYEVQKYIIETGHIYDTSPLLASQRFWDGLSESDRKMISDAVGEVLTWERKISIEDQAAIRVKLSGNGSNGVIQLTPNERAAFRKAAQPVYDKYADKIGRSLLTGVDAVNSKFN